MTFKNVHIIGTSHIAKESLKEIEQAFDSLKPGVVAVELDRKRMHALHSKEPQKLRFSDMRHVGLKGYLFAVIGRYVQHKLGNVVGVSPGSEMKLAVSLAQKHKAKVALIDQDIDITLRRFSQALSWREKFRFVGDMFRSLFRRKKAMEELGLKDSELDLSKVPGKELVRKLILHLKRRYPNIHRVLVAERNEVMASNIVKLMHKFSDQPILVVVGAGHEEELLDLIRKKYHLVDVVRP
ncbi:TPA: hypothetical protein HA265_05540 [Candidatus Woesearchaeota archaeon]|nr:hypothetical protein [Candidatus Woesearchaeota archaeon]